MAEDFEELQTLAKGAHAVEPLVMGGGQRAIVLAGLGDHEELVALTHGVAGLARSNEGGGRCVVMEERGERREDRDEKEGKEEEGEKERVRERGEEGVSGR